MRYQENQKKLNHVQLIINACTANEATQKRKGLRSRTARERPVQQRSSFRSAVQAMVTVSRDAYHIATADGGKTFSYLELGEVLDLDFAVS